jgi:hypothetical protein
LESIKGTISKDWSNEYLLKICLPRLFVVEGKVHGGTNIPSMTIAITFQMFDLANLTNSGPPL